MEDNVGLLWPEWNHTTAECCCAGHARTSFSTNWSQRQPSAMPQLILLMHFSSTFWQQCEGHTLLAVGGVSCPPGMNCLSAGNRALPITLDWSRLPWNGGISWTPPIRCFHHHVGQYSTSIWEKEANSPNPSESLYCPKPKYAQGTCTEDPSPGWPG